MRQKLLVDQDVQGLLLRRAAMYGAACAVYFLAIFFVSESLRDSDEPLSAAIARCLGELMYWLPGFFLLIPVIGYDLVRTSSRFSGPIFRLRREMSRLAEGRDVGRLKFRRDDHWLEMSELFNEIRDELVELRSYKREHSASKTTASSAKSLLGAESAETEDVDFLATGDH